MIAKRRGFDNIFNDGTVENFPSLQREANIKPQEVWTTPTIFNQRRLSAQCLVVQIAKVQDKESKTSKRKASNHI